MSRHITRPFRTIADSGATVCRPTRLHFGIEGPRYRNRVRPPFRAFISVRRYHGGLLSLLHGVRRHIIRFNARFLVRHDGTFFHPSQTAVNISRLVRATKSAIISRLRRFTVQIGMRPRLNFI